MLLIALLVLGGAIGVVLGLLVRLWGLAAAPALFYWANTTFTSEGVLENHEGPYWPYALFVYAPLIVGVILGLLARRGGWRPGEAGCGHGWSEPDPPGTRAWRGLALGRLRRALLVGDLPAGRRVDPSPGPNPSVESPALAQRGLPSRSQRHGGVPVRSDRAFTSRIISSTFSWSSPLNAISSLRSAVGNVVAPTDSTVPPR
jgi:hypothetical protein